MRTIYAKLFRETEESASERKMYNRGWKLRHRTRKGTFEVFISSGSDDSVSVFREGQYLVVLSVNTRMGYCGIEVWDINEVNFEDYREDPIKNAPSVCEEVFYQNAFEHFDGDSWEGWSEWFLASVLFRETETGSDHYTNRHYQKVRNEKRKVQRVAEQ